MRDDLDDIKKDPTGDDTSSSNSFLKIEQEEVFNSLFLNWLERVEKYKV